jgi:hypothetical protein
MRGSALEYEPIQTLATVREVLQVTWDALGQSVVVEVAVGQEGGQLHRVAVALTPPAALQLLLELSEALSDTAPEEEPVQ